MKNKINPYDELPYVGYSYPASHPSRLATIAKLFGLTPSALDGCRVLEIGCASGANLLPMAASLPKAKFVGVDYSLVQIEAARKVQKELELSNIEFRHEDLCDIDTAKLGKFDYVIAHGIYSWLPAQAQSALLKLSRECLAQNGVAFISYNTLPGWHLRGMVRDLMSFHADSFGDGPPDIGQAKAILDFIGTHVPTENNPWGQYLKQEVMRVVNEPNESYIAHDYFEVNNEALYLRDFVGRAQKADLDYLGDAELFSMLGAGVDAAAKNKLANEIKDIVRLEQYYDFMTNRGFRMTLLVPRGSTPNRTLDAERIYGFWASLPGGAILDEMEMSEEELSSNMPMRLQLGSTGSYMTTTSSVTKAALMVLAKAFPANVPCEALLKAAREHLTKNHNNSVALEQDRATLGFELLQAYTSNFLELNFKSNLALPKKDLEKVRQNFFISTYIRWQALTSNQITNLNHATIAINEPSRQTLILLDGSLDRQALTKAFYQLIESGTLAVLDDKGEPVKLKKGSSEVTDLLNAVLSGLAQQALLQDSTAG